MLMTIILVLLVLSLIGGGVGYSRFGFAGMGPAGLLLVVLLVLFLSGHLA